MLSPAQVVIELWEVLVSQSPTSGNLRCMWHHTMNAPADELQIAWDISVLFHCPNIAIASLLLQEKGYARQRLDASQNTYCIVMLENCLLLYSLN